MLEVTVPAAYQGDVMGDLNARRGRVQGTESGNNGEQIIVAQVPTSEIQRYAIDLRSLTGGRGRFTVAPQPLRPAAVPPRRQGEEGRRGTLIVAAVTKTYVCPSAGSTTTPSPPPTRRSRCGRSPPLRRAAPPRRG